MAKEVETKTASYLSDPDWRFRALQNLRQLGTAQFLSRYCFDQRLFNRFAIKSYELADRLRVELKLENKATKFLSEIELQSLLTAIRKETTIDIEAGLIRGGE